MLQTLFEEIIKTIENGGKAPRVTTTVGYTKEQAEAIQRLVNAKDNYERLGLRYGASRLALHSSVRVIFRWTSKLRRILHRLSAFGFSIYKMTFILGPLWEFVCVSFVSNW